MKEPKPSPTEEKWPGSRNACHQKTESTKFLVLTGMFCEVTIEKLTL